MPAPSPAPDSKRLRAGCRLARLCGTIWRETGAKRGDFLLQTATIGARSERVGTEKSITYPLRLPLPRLGRVWAHGSAFTLAALGRRKGVHLARNRRFESISLQRRVRCEPVSRGNSPSYVEKPRFSAGVRRSVGGAGGGDAQGGAISHQGTAISLSGLIPAPQCRRPVLTTV